jgi:hypothetical protein
MRVRRITNTTVLPSNRLISVVTPFIYRRVVRSFRMSNMHAVASVLLLPLLLPNFTIICFYLQVMLNYLMKHVVCEEVCGLLNWRLGHQILFLCYKLMSTYDTVEFFYGESQIDHYTIPSIMKAQELTPNFVYYDIRRLSRK